MKEPLWAPWRLEYIRMSKPKGCFFCVKLNEDRDEDNLVLYRGQLNFVLLNSYPYNPGHLMVAPHRHIPDLAAMSQEEVGEHFELVRRMVALLQEAFGAHGFNIGINLGEVAGAGVLDHVHTHIVPRWQGDTNYMPVTGATKVLPMALMDVYTQLKRGLTR